MSSKEWAYGDRVQHAKRPEWGIGVITSAQREVHEGKPCQRVTIRFDRAGIKTMSTALAELNPATEAISSAPEAANGAGNGDDSDWLARLSGTSVEERMVKLPEACTDPFSTLTARLTACLALYRFTDTGASLLDWAAAQSGLKDPMSRFNRHELEVLFQKFAFTRDEHVRRLVVDVKKKDPAELAAAMRAAPPGAQPVVRRFDGGR
jgi:hypothetical protein